eukprot:9006527-Pyramimonas_sp.AAC.1
MRRRRRRMIRRRNDHGEWWARGGARVSRWSPRVRWWMRSTRGLNAAVLSGTPTNNVSWTKPEFRGP